MDYRKICEQLIAELRRERDLHNFYYEEFRKTEDLLRLDPDVQADKQIGELIEDRISTREQIDQAIAQIDRLEKLIDGAL